MAVPVFRTCNKARSLAGPPQVAESLICGHGPEGQGVRTKLSVPTFSLDT